MTLGPKRPAPNRNTIKFFTGDLSLASDYMGYTWGFSHLQAWCEPKKGCSHCKKAASITWG